MEPIRILIADDDPGMLLLMRKLIERAEDYQLVGEAQNGENCWRYTKSSGPKWC